MLDMQAKFLVLGMALYGCTVAACPLAALGRFGSGVLRVDGYALKQT
jgi:hypothetical protein